MKIFGVLAILSTLYTQGTTLMCNKVDDFSNAASIVLGEETCDGGVTTCVRPIFKATGAYQEKTATVIWGCGECVPPASCVSCVGEKCNAAARKCLDTSDVSTNPESKSCPDTDTVKSGTFVAVKTCVRPIVNDGGSYEALAAEVIWGCGVCSPSASCVSCEGDDCNAAPLKCLTTSDVSTKPVVVESKACPDTDTDVTDTFVAEKTCVRPEISYGKVVNTKVVYGCGNCEDGEDAVENCETCTESDCNSIPTDKHMCYTYKLEDDKWVVSEEMSDCVSGDDDKEKCNMPEDLDVKEGYSAGGCGPCKSEDEGCKVTEPEKNAGEIAALSLLVTVLPLLYIML